MAKNTRTRKTVAKPEVNHPPDQTDTPVLLATRLQAKAMSSALEWQMGIFDFTIRRLEEDLNFASALSHPSGPGDILSAYSGFLKTSLDDYSHEASRTAALVSDALSGSMAVIRHAADTNSGQVGASKR